MKLEELREKVVKTCQDFYQNGLVLNTGTGGNISARDPDSGLIVVTPSQVRYDTIAAKDMVVTNLEGEIVESQADYDPTSELPTHRLIYKEFPEVNAVIHDHSTYANVLASLYSEIPAMHTEFAYFIGPTVPVAEYVTPGTMDMAEVVVEKLQEAPAMVLRNHGPVAVGEDLKVALDRALAVEDSAEIYYNASVLGEPRVISKEECEEIQGG